MTKLFSLYLQYFPTLSITYGSLGTIIVFLLWVNLICMITLMGALITNVLEKTKQVQGVRFEWDSEHDKIKNDKQIAFPTAFSGESIGFIAQDLEKVIPELVFTDDDGYKSVEYGQLVSLGIGSIQEQQRTIDSIYERINKLKEIIGG